MFPAPTFGCRFWSPADREAYNAEVIETALQLIYANLFNLAGKTKLPQDVHKLDFATFLRLQATAIRLVKALGLLP